MWSAVELRETRSASGRHVVDLVERALQGGLTGPQVVGNVVRAVFRSRTGFEAAGPNVASERGDTATKYSPAARPETRNSPRSLVCAPWVGAGISRGIGGRPRLPPAGIGIRLSTITRASVSGSPVGSNTLPVIAAPFCSCRVTSVA